MCSVVTFPHSATSEDFSFSFRSSVPKDKVYLYHHVSLDGSHCQMMENMILDFEVAFDRCKRKLIQSTWCASGRSGGAAVMVKAS